MNEVWDFFVNALPWIAIGLFIAVSSVKVTAEREGKEAGRLFRAICWSPALCFLVVGLLEMADGNKAGGTTWLVLAVFQAVTNYAGAEQ